MGTNIIVNREKCNQTIMYIQRQYDQIMYMAKKSQERGIDALCVAWQSENSEAAVKELVVNLNATFKIITKRYRRLINKLNNFAEAIFKSGGGHWKRIEFLASKEYQFSARNAKNGQFKYDETAVTEAIGRIRQLSRSIEKNQRETIAKFARNNEVFGKRKPYNRHVFHCHNNSSYVSHDPKFAPIVPTIPMMETEPKIMMPPTNTQIICSIASARLPDPAAANLIPHTMMMARSPTTPIAIKS